MTETRESDPNLDPQWMAAHGGQAFFRPSAELIAATGEDRHRFLNGFVTNDVSTLVPQAWGYGFCANVKGRVLTDFYALSLAERLLLEVPGGQSERITEHLLKYRIADRADLTPQPLSVLVVFGENPKGLQITQWPSVDQGISTTSAVGELTVVRRPVAGLPAAVLYLPEDSLAPACQRLGAAGFEELSTEAWDCLHVEAGRLRFGPDFGEDCFPQETGLDGEAVSYTKGCYLGQEVIARIHYRGGVNRHPRGLRFESELPATGSELEFEGRGVGKVGSVALSARFGAIGLAILHRRGADIGTRLEVVGAGQAEVVDLPFVLEEADG